MTYVLVTGATGFAGAYIVDELLRHGHRVRAMVRKDRPTSSLDGMDVDLCYADLAEPDSLRESVKGVDAVIHPAYSIEARTGDDPFMEFKINEEGSLVLLEASRLEGVEKFIFTSSGASVGYRSPTKWMPEYPIDESSPRFPTDVYGAAKAAMEMWCFAYYHQYGLDTVTLRTMWVYGPYRIDKPHLISLGSANNAPDGLSTEQFIQGDDFLGTFYRYTEMALNNADIKVPGGGFHMTHVRDLAKAHRLALEKSDGGEIYNVNDDYVSWKAFLERILELTGSGSKLTFQTVDNDPAISNQRIKDKLGMEFSGMAGLDECITGCVGELQRKRRR